MTRPRPLPPLETVKKYLKYEPETGLLWWTQKPNRNMPNWRLQPAGTCRQDGYLYVRLLGSRYLAHRIAWLLYYCKDPDGSQVDHKDQDKQNNKITNLRLVTNQQNQFNRGASRSNKSGIKGVCWDAKSNKWRAYGRLNGKQNLIGLFSDLSEAAKARASWEESILKTITGSQ